MESEKDEQQIEYYMDMLPQLRTLCKIHGLKLSEKQLKLLVLWHPLFCNLMGIECAEIMGVCNQTISGMLRTIDKKYPDFISAAKRIKTNPVEVEQKIYWATKLPNEVFDKDHLFDFDRMDNHKNIEYGGRVSMGDKIVRRF